MKLYDKKTKRIVMFKERATAEFWDKHWQIENFVERVRKGKKNRIMRKYTTKFLKPRAKILEGGCGIGQNVYGLKFWGYDSYGVDIMQSTIRKIKKAFPGLQISVQDIRKMNFPDNFFGRYWSLGVIEHFWEGYDEILKEAKRIIKPGGY